MNQLFSLEELRNMEGLAKRTTETFERIVKNITQGGEVITLAESNIDVE